MPNLDVCDETLFELDPDQLDSITGGAGPSQADLDEARKQAQAYCPTTAAKYSKVDTGSLNRGTATTMANECLTEMGGFKAMIARPRIEAAIDKAFPR